MKLILIKMSQFNLVKLIIKNKRRISQNKVLNNYLIFCIFQKLLKIIEIRNPKVFLYNNNIIQFLIKHLIMKAIIIRICKQVN